MTSRIEHLLTELTLAEKVELLAGSDNWHTAAVERLGIGRLKMTDGPTGARGDGASGVTSTCFPVGAALGASWSPDLLGRIGAALAVEAEAKGAHLLLGPTVNLQRHPVTGRTFECYSEDPELSAALGTAFVRGVEARGTVGACVKHFVANDQEFERHSIDARVDEDVLRENHLRPFEDAVAAGVWSVMSAYNRLNGTFCSSNHWLLEDLLRDEWGWPGAVVSDWGAGLETVDNANGGLDIEMPGPTRTRGEALVAAVEAGEVTEATVDRHVHRVLHLLDRAGRLDRADEPAEESLDSPEHRALAHEAAVTGTVLLTNDGVLPLDPDAVSSVALIGPNADPLLIQGGGSSMVFPHRRVGLVEAVQGRFRGATVTLAEGCPSHRYVPLADRSWWATPDGAPGLACDFVSGGDPSAPAEASRVVGQPAVPFTMVSPPPVSAADFSAVYEGTVTVPDGGAYDVGACAAGLVRVFVAGDLVVDNWTDPDPGDIFFTYGSAERRAVVDLPADTPVDVRIEFRRDPTAPIGGIRVGLAPVPDVDAGLAEAEAVAAAADVAVVVVGMTDEWESEGFDRASFHLPGRQDELVRRVAAANPRTVVAVNAGSAVAMDWADDVAAALQCWYGGQELGPALAAVLAGDDEPGGRLPFTVPVRLEDAPAHAHYPGVDGRVTYGEGHHQGHRHYETGGVEPRFWLGHGLGFGRTAWGPVSASGEGTDVSVSVPVTNTGDRRSATVVQVYAEPADGARPRRLVGFARVEVPPGATDTATVRLDARAFRRWVDGRWQVPTGGFRLDVAPSADPGSVHASVDVAPGG